MVGQGVGGHHHPRAHQAPDGAHVGAQFSGVTTTTTFTVKIPDSGKVSSPGSRKLNHKVKLELAKYYKDSEMTAFISERSRNSKGLKKYGPPKNEK